MKPYRRRGTKYTESHRWLSGFPGQEEDPQISIPPVLPQNMRSFGEWFSVVSSWPAQHLRCLSHDSLPLQTRRQTELGPHAPAALFALPPALCMPVWHMQHSPERQVSPFIHFSLLVQVVAEEKKFKLLQHLALSNLWMCFQSSHLPLSPPVACLSGIWTIFQASVKLKLPVGHFNLYKQWSRFARWLAVEGFTGMSVDWAQNCSLAPSCCQTSSWVQILRTPLALQAASIPSSGSSEQRSRKPHL